VYIQTGTAELLYSEDLQLAKGMKEEGVDVRLREVSDNNSLTQIPFYTGLIKIARQIKDDIHASILFQRKPSMEATQKDLKEIWGTV
jgi:hypothetical protein